MKNKREIEYLSKWMSDAMILAEMVASMEPGDKVGDIHVALAQHVSGTNEAFPMFRGRMIERFSPYTIEPHLLLSTIVTLAKSRRFPKSGKPLVAGSRLPYRDRWDQVLAIAECNSGAAGEAARRILPGTVLLPYVASMPKRDRRMIARLCRRRGK